ncbi:MAG: glycerate kinase [Saprospiraceae bacterium]
MKILIAPLPFKNSLTAFEAAKAIKKGVTLHNPHLNIELSPIEKNQKSIVNWSEIEEQIKKSDCIITGEGQIDEVSFEEKAIGEIVNLCKKHNKTIIVIAGKHNLKLDNPFYQQIAPIYTITEKASSEEEAFLRAAHYLERIGRRVI